MNLNEHKTLLQRFYAWAEQHDSGPLGRALRCMGDDELKDVERCIDGWLRFEATAVPGATCFEETNPQRVATPIKPYTPEMTSTLGRTVAVITTPRHGVAPEFEPLEPQAVVDNVLDLLASDTAPTSRELSLLASTVGALCNAVNARLESMFPRKEG